MTPGEPQTDLEQLLAEHLGTLYRYSLGLARGSAAIAEDCLLEAVDRAAKFPASLPGSKLDRAWLFGLLTDVYRERDEAVDPRTHGQMGGVADGETYLTELVRLMGEGDLETRVAWWLGLVEGFRVEELAEVLGIPELLVESRLEHARGILALRLYELAGAAGVGAEVGDELTAPPIPFADYDQQCPSLPGRVAAGRTVNPI